MTDDDLAEIKRYADMLAELVAAPEARLLSREQLLEMKAMGEQIEALCVAELYGPAALMGGLRRPDARA